MQVSFTLIGRYQQGEQQIDRLIINGIKGDRLLKADKHANGPQSVLFQFAVWDRDTVADTGTAHTFPGEYCVKHHLRR
ncbi:hypothetical protein D3C77_738770 [compost metagenome]